MKVTITEQKNMTDGKILPILLLFALPVLFGNLVQQIYSFVDSIIVGQYLGASALASIGATDSLTYLFLGCTNGIAAGFSVCIAQAWGRKDIHDLRIYAARITQYTIYISLFLAVVLAAGNPLLLSLMNTPVELRHSSSIYLTILFAGMPCSMGLNSILSILRALGDSKISFYLLLISSFTNVGLDYLLVGVLPMGVAGAALATVLAQLFVLCIALFYTKKNYPQLHFTQADRKCRTHHGKALIQTSLFSEVTSVLKSSVIHTTF